MGKPRGCLVHGLHDFVPADAETAGEPEAHEHDWSEWGAVYHGGHLRWRKCFGCIEVQSIPEGHFCPDCAPVCESPKGCHAPSACWESCAFGDQLRGIRPAPRPEPEPEAPKTWPCGDCGANVLFELDDCPECERRRLASRRPPYAVAYALASGELYEVVLPGDAVATVEHGVLKVSHAEGVVHMIQVKPMEG